MSHHGRLIGNKWLSFTIEKFITKIKTTPSGYKTLQIISAIAETLSLLLSCKMIIPSHAPENLSIHTGNHIAYMAV